MSLDIPLGLSAFRLAKSPFPLPRVLFETKFVPRIGFVAQSRHQCVRTIWNAHTVVSQKPQPGNHRRRLRAVHLTSPPTLVAVGAVLAKEGVEFARKNESGDAPAADLLDDALVQKTRDALLQIFGSR
jgi:hypothetical protein